MVQAGDADDALEAARRLLAARDAELGDADRMLTETVAAAHRIAVDAIGRIDAIESDVEATATDQSRDTAAGAREVGRNLVAKNREIAAVVSDTRDAVAAKTVALKAIAEQYRRHSPG